MARRGKHAFNNLNNDIANEVGVNLKQGYTGDLSSRQTGSAGGDMAKRVYQQQVDTSTNSDHMMPKR